MRTASISGANVTTTYGHDGQTVVAEYLGSCLTSAPQRKYLSTSYVDEQVLLIDRTAAGSTGAGTDERFYYHRNQQYSITALCDNSGTVVELYAYTAYGEPIILDGAGTTTRTTSFINNPYLYTARAYDAESGMYYFRARIYEGRKGRFLSHDPILYPDGYNTYAGWFANNHIDPSGMGKISKKECEIAKKKALESPVVESQIAITESISGCTRPNIICGDCSGKVAGGYNPATNTIILCTSVPDSATSIVDHYVIVLIHELIHKSDDCQWPLPDPDKITCKQLLCIEARAYSCSNDCPQADANDRAMCLRHKLGVVIANDEINGKMLCGSDPESQAKMITDVLNQPGCTCPKPCGNKLPDPPKPPKDYNF